VAEYIKTCKEGLALLDNIKKIVENDEHRSSRPVAAIAVIDCMVKEHLAEGEKQRWTTDVVQPWYDSSDRHTDDVLRRANCFLRDSEEGFDGIMILLKAFDTGSYVVFMTMPSLASVLLFQHLELRKLGCMQSCNEAAGAAGAPDPSLHGFQLFASSGRGVFHATDDDRPARNMPAIIQGLQCLKHLTELDWEMLGPVKSAREFLQAEFEVHCDESQALPRLEDRAVGDFDGVLMASPDRDERKKAVLRQLADTEFTDATGTSAVLLRTQEGIGPVETAHQFLQEDPEVKNDDHEKLQRTEERVVGRTIRDIDVVSGASSDPETPEEV